MMPAPFGTDPGQPALDAVLEGESLLADELQDDGGDERLGDAADAEAVVRAHRRPGLQVAVAAGEADRPAALADEQHRPRDAGGDDPIERGLELRLAYRRGGRRRRRDDERHEGGQEGERASHGGVPFHS